MLRKGVRAMPTLSVSILCVAGWASHTSVKNFGVTQVGPVPPLLQPLLSSLLLSSLELRNTQVYEP